MARRQAVRDEILRRSWASGFPGWPLFRLVGEWFERNKTNVGFFICWPQGRRGEPVGTRVGFFTADSPTRALVIGWARFGREDFARLTEEHRVLSIRVFGWLRITKDVDLEVAARSLESVKVLGISRMPQPVRELLTGVVA